MMSRYDIWKTATPPEYDEDEEPEPEVPMTLPCGMAEIDESARAEIESVWDCPIKIVGKEFVCGCGQAVTLMHTDEYPNYLRRIERQAGRPDPSDEVIKFELNRPTIIAGGHPYMVIGEGALFTDAEVDLS